MGETIQTSENEVKVSATGKRLTYDHMQWYRKDLYDRQSEAILAEQRVVRDLKDYVAYLQNLLNEAGVAWQVMDHE
jgi:hypothetical protein